MSQTNYKHLYEVTRRMVERYQDEIMPSYRKEIEQLKKESQWISTKTALPAPGQIVMVHQVYSWEHMEEGAAVTIGRLRPTPEGEVPYWEFQHYRPDFRSGTCMDNDIICPGSEYVTHWMPLPEAPKEGV